MTAKENRLNMELPKTPAKRGVLVNTWYPSDKEMDGGYASDVMVWVWVHAGLLKENSETL